MANQAPQARSDEEAELNTEASGGGVIIPESFESGDLTEWLADFAVIADANQWNEAQRLNKLPAFLQRPCEGGVPATPSRTA